MHRIDTVGATEDGRFKSSPLPATRLGAEWHNAVQEEIAHVIEHVNGGATALNKEDNGQLLAAIARMITVATPISVNDDNPSEITVTLGPLQLKIGYYRVAISGEVAVSVVFDTPFPNGCWSVMPVSVIAAASNRRDLWPQVIDPLRSRLGFTLQFQAEDSEDNIIGGFDWWAIGN